jgi:hypothetical protein
LVINGINHFFYFLELTDLTQQKVVRPWGLEPQTNWLKANCSAIELRSQFEIINKLQDFTHIHHCGDSDVFPISF